MKVKFDKLGKRIELKVVEKVVEKCKICDSVKVKNYWIAGTTKGNICMKCYTEMLAKNDMGDE